MYNIISLFSYKQYHYFIKKQKNYLYKICDKKYLFYFILSRNTAPWICNLKKQSGELALY